MELEPWDPWREFERVRAQADELFSRYFKKFQQLGSSGAIAFIPSSDVIETREDLRILLSLPGVVEEDIDIGVEDGSLVVCGERECPYDKERIQTHHAEWQYGYFERRFDLPEGARPEGFSASFRWGVLTVVIPKGPIQMGTESTSPPNRPGAED